MQNGCQFHIKFHEEYKNELYFNLRSWNRMKFLPKLYHTIRSYFTTKVELLQLIKRQLEIININFQRIYEDNQSLPNGTDRKSKFKICKMDQSKNELYFNLRSYPMKAEVKAE